jgi:hypothetical protein
MPIDKTEFHFLFYFKFKNNKDLCLGNFYPDESAIKGESEERLALLYVSRRLVTLQGIHLARRGFAP